MHAPAGSALIFCGEVTHGALPVVAGQRAVFVASFGPIDLHRHTSPKWGYITTTPKPGWSQMDPLAIVVARGREKGIQVICSLRMNDATGPADSSRRADDGPTECPDERARRRQRRGALPEY